MTQQQPPDRARPATSALSQFAARLTRFLQAQETGWGYLTAHPSCLQVEREDGQTVNLDLTPFAGQPQTPDAAPFFADVKNLESLLGAYRCAKASCEPEPDSQVHAYASQYLEARFSDAHDHYSDEDARRIACWVSGLDRYAAVKSVESLLDCRDNLALFDLAPEKDWQVHFDHLAIRCGSAARGDAEALIERLQQTHGYVQPQLDQERYYQFKDGWNAYPLYKILDNGQVIRLFVDQSNADDQQQIIQHWNRVYGFTAHHLALRVTRLEAGHPVAVPLKEVIDALTAIGVPSLQPTGFYTHGLLEQVFLKPQRNDQIPAALKSELSAIDPALATTIENGKLIELVSRRELPADLAEAFFRLYGLDSLPGAQPHSAVMYPYFLPAQAAHVILTSLQSEAN